MAWEDTIQEEPAKPVSTTEEPAPETEPAPAAEPTPGGWEDTARPAESATGGGWEATAQDEDPAETETATIRAMAEKPKVPGRFITDEDLGQLGTAYGVALEFLRKAAGWFGGRAYQESRLLSPLAVPEEIQALGERLLLGESDQNDTRPSAEKTEGVVSGLGEMAKYNVGRALGFLSGDLPQNVVRKALAHFGELSDDESDALVGLQQLIHNRRPWSEAGSQLAANLMIGGAAFPEELAAQTAVGAGIGAVSGAAESEEGHELHDALLHGAMGAGLAVVGAPLMKGITWLAGSRQRAANYVTRKLVDEAGGEARVAERMSKMAAEDAPAEEVLTRIVRDDPRKRLSRRAFETQTSDDDRRAVFDLALRSGGKTEEKARSTIAALEAAGPEGAAAPSPSDIQDTVAFEYMRRAGGTFRRLLQATGADTPSIKAARGQQGDEYVDRLWGAFRAGDRVARSSAELVDEGAGAPSAVSRMFRFAKFFADDRAVLSAIDRRYPGFNLASEGDLGSARFNAATIEVGTLMQDLDGLAPLLRKMEPATASGEKLTPQVLGRALNEGDVSGLTKNQAEVVRGLADWQEKAAQAAEGFAGKYGDLHISPIKIGRNLSGPEQTYMHNTVQAPVEYVMNLTDALKRAGGTDGLLERAEAGGRDSLHGQVLRGLEIWAGGEIEDPKALRAAVSSLREMRIDGEALQTRARSLMKRTGEIPEFLMEMDPFKASARWAHSTFRHLAARDMIAQYTAAARSIGGTNPILADHLKTMVRDLSGVRRDTWGGVLRGAWMKAQLGLERDARIAEESGNHKTAGALRAAAGLDRFYSAMTANQYAYFLGARPITFLKNMVQPVATTLPALATSDPVVATALMSKAYAKTARDLFNPVRVAHGGFFGYGTNAKQILLKEGLRPSGMTFDANRWLQDGMAAGSRGRLGKSLESMSKASMVLFDLADVTNRTVTRHVAHDLVDALARDLPAMSSGGRMSETGKLAAEAIASAEPAYRDVVLGHIRSGDIDEAKNAMARYLNGSTQYNYNRAAMSEYGRAMGSAFSMFTKWPSVAAGDMLTLWDTWNLGRKVGGEVAHEFERKAMQAAWKYMAPIAFASVIGDKWAEKSADSPRFKQLAGRSPLAWTSADSLQNLGARLNLTDRGESMFPPIVENLGKAIASGVTLDGRGVVEALGEGAISAAPGAVWLRFLMRDAPALLFDREHEGGTTAQKLSNKILGER